MKRQDCNKRMPAFQIEIRIEYDRTVVQLGSNSTDFFFFFKRVYRCDMRSLAEHISSL